MLETLLRTIRDYVVVLWRLILSICLLALCALSSWIGVWYAAGTSHCDTDGGRGGAAAVMLSIFVIFLTPNYASRLYRILSEGNARKKESGGADTKIVVQIEIQSLFDLLDGDANRLFVQNVFFALATITGTFFWGFGDYFAKSIMKSHGIVPSCH